LRDFFLLGGLQPFFLLGGLGRVQGAVILAELISLFIIIFH
jgi:hypothetical protein